MYQSLYTLISELIFNGTMTALQAEIVTWLSTIGSLFVAVLPLFCILWLIRFVLGSWR